MRPTKVVVAMSGGVDSSVAAALLVSAGHDVTGITLDVWPADEEEAETGRSCCGFAAAEDARRVCHRLGISHYVLNFRDIFEKRVIDDFCNEYVAGRTPNPCIRCNELVKFDDLLRRARALGATHLATGHYARIKRAAGGYSLRKAVDKSKDQSYVLYTIDAAQMGQLLFPLGDMRKDAVRSHARALGLRVAGKADSQEICFVTSGGYADFIRRRARGSGAGRMILADGSVVGRHDGVEGYTVGQRRGLGTTVAGPKYVVSIDARTNAVTIGDDADLYAYELIAKDVRWPNGPPSKPLAVSAKVRYNMKEAPAVVEPLADDKAIVSFKTAQRAIAPGQAVVFYKGDAVAGGGTIENVIHD